MLRNRALAVVVLPAVILAASASTARPGAPQATDRRMTIEWP